MFNKATKIKDFSGENIYVGIDTHAKSWMVSIYSNEFELKTFSQVPDVAQLSGYLRKHYPGAHYQLAYEAGFCGFWMQRQFLKVNIACSVIHPGDVPTSDKDRKRKSDKVDSRKIARGLRSGELNEVFVPDELQEADRQLLRSRARIVKDNTMVKNRIKSFLKVRGIAIPSVYGQGTWSRKFIEWIDTIEFAESSNKIALSVYREELIFLMNQQKQLLQAIAVLAKTERYANNVRLLKTIPSIGALSAMTILTEIGDINRFKKPEHLFSYCGITPTSHSSGERERIGSVSKRGNPILKTMLIECAWTAVKKDPALLLYYKQQLPKMNANKAIIKVSRKLANRIRYVLKEQKEYIIGIVE
jgi:transposase